MEDLLSNQNQIVGAMQQLLSNFKKDGADRKTSALIKKRLDTLETYWKEFVSLHVRITDLCDESHPYVAQNQYEQVLDFYTKTKVFIQSYQPTEERPRPETPVLKPSILGNQSSSKQSIVTEERGCTSKLDDMLRKQASNFRALKRSVRSTNLESLSEKWELEDALKILQSRWSTIDTLHWELDSELEGANELYEQEYSHYENIYNNMKKNINTKIWSVSNRELSTPKLEIPVFSGNYHQWTSFKDLFIETIHNNRALSNAQKMQFIKTKVRGEAERLIQHLPISSENYSVAWDILNHRYNNLRLIFSSHVNILMNIPVSQQVSLHHLKKIHDTARETLNAIKNLGVDVTTWDPLIVHILSQKLDNETLQNYMQSLKQPRDLPNLKDFLEFLETSFTAMESSRKKLENNVQAKPSNFNSYTKPQKQQNYNKQSFASNRIPQKYNTVSQSSNNKTLRHKWNKCPLCDKEHGLYHCKEFLDMSSTMKHETVAKLNLCTNCLFNHNGKICISDKKCRECNESHNSLLHEAFTKPTMATPKPSWLKSTTNSNHNFGHEKSNSNSHVTQQRDIPEILLATAVIKVQGADGAYRTLRALIDQGSQTSLITENAAQQLGLPRRKCRGVITGVGVKDNSCKGMINIHCQPNNDSSYAFNTDAYIMNSLTKNLPNFTFIKPSWDFLSNIQLADQEFYVSRPIDLLLGADVYSHIILEGICRADQSSPIAQQTRLGWILCGHVKTLQCNVVLNNIDDIQQFWEIEDISEESTLSLEDNKCVQFYKSTTKRLEDGRYEVRLPLIPNFENQLGRSRPMAIAQFTQLERKFKKKKRTLQNNIKPLSMNTYL